MSDYSERAVWDVDIYDLTTAYEAGDRVIGAIVHFDLASEGGGAAGPGARCRVSVSANDGEAFPDIERRLLGAALDVLKRLAQSSPDELWGMVEEQRKAEDRPHPA